jgi:predicted benzoate:H+ symporter BenE
MRFKHYFHPPAIAAGFIAVLVGYSSSSVIVFQAAMVAGVMTMFVFRGNNK